MRTILLLPAVSCLIATSIVAGPLSEARINKIINEVSVIDPAKGARPAALQEVIKDEIGVKTGIKSRSELLFQDETLTRIGPESYFSFKPGTRDMSLQQGTMLLQVPKGLGGARIRTAAVTASITGTTVMLENIPGKVLKVLVLEGSMRLSVNGTFGDSLLLLPGKMVIMPANAKRIPDPVSVDLAKITKTSSLVKMGGKGKPLPSQELIQHEIDVQASNKSKTELVETNLAILGGGSRVEVVTDSFLTAMKADKDFSALRPEPTPTTSASPTPSTSPTPSASPTPGASPTPSTSPTPGASPTPSTSPTPGASPTPSASPNPSATPRPSPSPHSAVTLVEPNDLPLTGSFHRVSALDLELSENISADDVRLEADNDIVSAGTITANDFKFDAGHDAFFDGVVRAKKIDGKADHSIAFLSPIAANDIKLDAPIISAPSINAPHKLEIHGILRNSADTILASSHMQISGGIDISGQAGSTDNGGGAGYSLTILGSDKISIGSGSDAINGINADGGSALAGTSLSGGSGGIVNIGTAVAPVQKDVTLQTSVSATSGANGNTSVAGGNGGTVNVVANRKISVQSTVRVSDSAPGHASRRGGNISLESRRTSGTAIEVTSSAQLLSLLANAAPGPGGTIKFTSAGGAINMNGTARADRGTVDIRNNGNQGVVNLTNATLHGDTVKAGVLGSNGTLNVGGGTIDADSTIDLYAAGSNGTINFTNNVTLSGNSVKTISANTVTINNGRTVTVLGPLPANVFTNNPNYTGFGGNNSTTGTFAGSGATTQPLSSAPGL